MMARPAFQRPAFSRPRFSRPSFLRPALHRPPSTIVVPPITITSAVMTFTGFSNATLVCALSSAPGDVGPFGTTYPSWTLHAAGASWDLSGAEGTVSGTTLTINGIARDTTDSNYSSAQDLLNYDGTDSTNLPGVAAVTNLPVTFTGGPLAVPSGTWTISGDFEEVTGVVAGSFSRAAATISEAEDGTAFTGESGSFTMGFGENPSLLDIDGTDFQIAFIGSAGANVAVASITYIGTRTDMVDTASPARPIPPFTKALSAP